MDAKVMLWTLMATCLWWSGSSRSISHFSSFLQNKVYEENATYRLSGPNGYCATVFIYIDGNPIILWPCQSNASVNQLWTFLSDGTIRSNGKCLTTSNYSQGSHIVIDDCDTADKDATIWELQEAIGEIANPRSGLVLTAVGGTVGTWLTLEVNESSSFQTWRVDNNTNPINVTIVWLKIRLCLQAIEMDVLLATCEGGNPTEIWLSYSDGTIRPQLNPDRCLSYDNLIDAKVLLESCGLDPSSQRWLFNAESETILNPRTGWVLDVDPDNMTVIVSPPSGNDTQSWEVVPLSVDENISII